MRLILLGLSLLIVGIAIGSFARPVAAQADSSILKVGQRLTLAYVGDRFVECNIAEIRGPLVRCEDTKITWFNVDNAISLTVR
jgi:hypothetical protein